MLAKTNLYMLLYLVSYPVYATLSSSSVIQRASLSNDQQLQLGNRQTKAMDLSDFNEFLSQTTLYIPDMLVEEGVPNNAKIKIENFYCSDLSIKKITDVSQEVSNKRTKYTINISGLEIFCRIKWTYFKGFFTEDVGGARFFAKNSDLQVVLDVMSDPFITNTETNDVSFYPTRTEQRDCNAKVNIQDMDFWGGIRAGVLNLLENSLQESFGRLIEDEICGQVESELTDALNEPLRKVIDQIEPYLNDLQLINIDPLSAQKELVLPEGSDVLNFETSESFKKVVDYVNRFLGDVVEDPNNNFSGEDLGINVLIRSNFLDDNRAYSISMEMLDNLVQGSNSTSEEIEVGDNMVQIQSELVSLSILGLDSFSSFVPLNPIGPQTLYNNFALRKLQLETKFQLHFSHTRHTRNNDFYIEIKNHSENFTAVTGIRNIDTSFSFLSALDFGRMNKLQVYNFVNQDHYQPCFRSITYGFNWTQLEILINNFDSPVVKNLFSPGIDSFASSVADTISDLYGDAFQSVIPNYLGTKTREILNRISEEKWQDEENTFCPTYDSTLDSNGSRKKYIDFRDLLLDPAESLVAGGSGESPYGNITHKLFDAMTDYIAKDKDGSPNVNRQIRLITNGQSGTPGTWILSNSSTPLLNTTIPFASVDMLNISLLETRLENLDSFGYPLEILQPKPGRAHVVDNHVALGVGSRSFRLSGNVEIQTESLYTNGTSNIVFQLEMPNIQLLFSILARITESLLMEIPYTELDNIYCWIATIPASELDEYGMLVDYTEEDFASVFNFDVLASDFKFNAECHGCTLSGMNELPQIFKLLNDIGVSHTTTRKILQNVQSKVQKTGLRSELSRIITDAQKRCPLHVEYIADFNGTEYEPLPDEPVTKQEAETMVLIGTIMAQVAMVVGSISTPDTDMTNNSLSGQVSIDNAEDVQLVDFINQKTTTDRLIETFFSSVNTMLGSLREDLTSSSGYTLGINSIVKSNILDEDGSFSFSLNTTLTDDILLESAKIKGLDSFIAFDGIDPIAAQTIQSKMELEHLKIELNMVLNTTSVGDDTSLFNRGENRMLRADNMQTSESMIISVEMQNIEINVALLLGLIEDKLGGLQLGTLFNTDQILSCVLSSIYDIDITQLKVSVGSLSGLDVEGFLSDDIREAIVLASESIVSEYGSDLRSAIPVLFDSVVRGLLNDEVKSYLSNTTCFPYEAPIDDSYIDFRDLFLNASEAAALGGSGEMPYGDLLSMLMEYVHTELIAPNDEGAPSINDKLIEPLTLSSSNISGTLLLQSKSECNNLLTVDDDADFVLALCDTAIENLDTVDYPLSILEPQSNENLLHNEFMIGHSSDPVRLQTQVHLKLNDYGLNIDNLFNASFTVETAKFFASIIAKIEDKKLLSLPLRDSLNPYCWLTTFAENSPEYQSLIPTINVESDGTSLGVECVACSNTAIEELPNIISVIYSDGVGTLINDKTRELFESFYNTSNSVSLLSQILENSGKNCPHHSSYVPIPENDEKWMSSLYLNNLDLAPLPAKDVQNMMLGLAVVSQAAIVVSALSLNELATVEPDPLSGQTILNSSPKPRLLDFDVPESTMEKIITAGLGVLERKLSSIEDAPTSSSGYTLGINSIVKSNMLDEDGSFSFSLNTTLTDDILLESAKIKGLDSFIAFDGIDPIAAQTMQSKMELDHLKIELNMILNTTSVGDDTSLFNRGENRMLRADNMQTSESMIISVEMQNIEINVALLLGLIEDKLGGLQLGTLFNTDQILSCVLSSIYDIDITQLKVSVGSLSGLDVEGFLSDDIREAIVLASESIVSEYGSDLRSAIPVLFDSVVRGLLNDEVKSYLSGATCFPYEAPIDDSYIDFRDLFLNASEAAALGGSGEMPYGDLLSMLMEYVHTELIAPNDEGAPSINDKLIEPLTLSSSNETGTIHIPGDVISKTIFLNESASSDDMIVVQVKDVSFENLNTISYPVQFLHPQDSEPYVLENRMVIGSEIDPLRLSSRVVLALQGDTSNLFNDFIIELELRNADAFIPLFLKVREALLLNIPLDDITNPFCWFASIPAPELNRFGLRDVDEEIYAKFLDLMFLVSDLQLNIDCVNCSSPGLLELGFFFTTSEGKEKSTMFGENLLNFTRNFFVGDYGQSEIDRFLNDAVGKCPHRKSEFNSVKYDKLSIAGVTTNASQVTLALSGFVAVFFVLVTTVNQFIKKRERIKHKRWLKTLSHEDIANLYAKQLYADKKEHSQKVHTKSIFFSGVVPLFVRILMPCVILVNIGLFLSGHLSLGGTVLLDIIFAGEEVRIQNFFEFAIAETVKDMWVEGLYALAVILFICSVIWPYVKQLILLVLWFTPPSLVSTTRRGKIFLSLDSLGKWSIIDIYVLMITLVVFRITVQSPNSSNSLAQTFYGLELLLLPMWGLYANMIAQLVSQVSSHFIIYYHRKIVKEGTLKFLSQEALRVTNSDDLCDMPIDVIPDNTNDAAEQLDPLSEHTYVEGNHKNEGEMKVKRCWNIFILCWGVTTILFLILGCSIPSLRLEVMGMAGKLIAAGSGPESLVQYHSVFTMIGVIMGEARYLASTSHYIGLGVLCTLLVGTSFFVPIAMSVLLLIIWFRPMTRKVRKRLVLTCEVLGAWQFIEVYIIAAFLGMWQIGDVTETMVKDFCKPLDSAFGSLAHFGILSEKDARCFYAFAILELGCYILIAASPMLSGLTYMILKAEKQQMTNLNDLMDKKKAKSIPTIPMSQDAEKTVHKLYKNIRPIPVQFTDIFKMMLCAEEEKAQGETVPLNALLSHDTSLLLKEENQAIVPEKDDKSDNISAPTAVPLHLS